MVHEGSLEIPGNLEVLEQPERISEDGVREAGMMEIMDEFLQIWPDHRGIFLNAITHGPGSSLSDAVFAFEE
jgi:hypothetical protein